VGVERVLVLGSGAIKIAEAAEFDYSGSQALKALREEGIETILVNPNVATIQTSREMADRVYLTPLKPEFVEKVIELERPDGIMVGFGGQSALSIGVALHRSGVLRRYGVRVLGTPIEGIEKALNRDAFRRAMASSGVPVPPSRSAHTVEEALSAAEDVGYPVIVRVSFNLSGRGTFVARDRREMAERLRRAFAHSEIGVLLVERYLGGWKEVEFEVVRDGRGNRVAVACLENVDPMGIHTGESIVVAPSQTLTNREYQMLRLASFSVADAIGLVGECNVQLALSPRSEEFYVIETNPRMSRSSALASKATGYPLAYIAAKLALGYTLEELKNKVTGVTVACFEPSLDYVVVKVPRWDLRKFDGVAASLDSEMKSIGEVMAIGRNLAEALQKAIRMLDVGEPGLVGGDYYEEDEDLPRVVERVRRLEPYWPLHVAKALRLGASTEELAAASGIDPFYINVIREVVEAAERLRAAGPGGLTREALMEAKEMGFSDLQIARLTGLDAETVRSIRKSMGIAPRVKQIDTLAAEWPASTNYLYMTYSSLDNDVGEGGDGRPKLLILGAGVFRIGVSVEFDWAAVNFALEARRRGYEVVMLNYNPETVSTDWDLSDKLYFEELTLERILDIYEHERPLGVVAFAGGQISNTLARRMEERGVPLLGTRGRSVDVAEDRSKFSTLVERLGFKQPEWTAATSIEEAVKFAREVGFPVIVRPSYVLSGTLMKVAYTPGELRGFLEAAARVSSEHPVVVSRFFDDAAEAEIDGVSDGSRVVGVTIQHIEEAGVHSGDSTMVTPPVGLPERAVGGMREAALSLALNLDIRGPFNLQFLVRNGDAYILELNLRASRSMPFSSKSRGVNLMELSAQACLEGGLRLGERGEYLELPWRAYGVKSPQFSWAQLRGSYPHLGPEMRSTGEAASLGFRYEDALAASWLSVTPNRVPRSGERALVYTGVERDRGRLGLASRELGTLGLQTLSLEGGEVDGAEKLSVDGAVELIERGEIGIVVTSGFTPGLDYRVRRAAADMNVPMVLNSRLACELARALRCASVNGVQLGEMAEYWAGAPRGRLATVKIL